jgi:hypothetical protein
MSQLPPEEPLGDLPAHPDIDETSRGGHQGTPVNWAMVLVFALIGILVLVILILHLTGVVGPAGHS